MAVKSNDHIPGFTTTAWLCLAFLYIPLLIVIIFSFNSGMRITVWEGFSLDWYHRAAENELLKQACINSLIVGVLATIFSTTIALMTAVAMHGNKLGVKTQSSTYFMMTLPLLIPEIVIAIASMAFFSLVGLNLLIGDLPLGNVLIAHTVFCIPFAYSPIRARMETLQPSLFEAAADLYATPWQAFRHVTLPLMMPGITSGAMLAFITSIDDFIITQMVAPPGGSTLPVYIYSMIRRNITPEINAVSTILLVLSIVMVSLSYIINRRKAA